MRPMRRRTMLRGAGGVAIALPLLDAMRSRRAAADQALVPRRLAIFYTPNGTQNQSGAAEGFANGLPAGPLTTMPLEAEALDALRSKLTIVSGVNSETSKSPHEGNGDLHSVGLTELLTGVKSTYSGNGGPTVAPDALPPMIGQGISIDQYVANAIGGATPRPSLQFGVQSETTPNGLIDGFCRMGYAAPAQPVPAITDPAKMFTRMFGDGDPGVDLDQIQAQRKSVLDAVMDDYDSLRTRVGPADARKLDDHLTAIRELEQSLSKPGVASCDAPMGFVADGDPDDPGNVPAVGRQHMDLLALAFQCDITRVASLQWSTARSALVHPWNVDGAGQPYTDVDHHTLTHQIGTAAPEVSGINGWYAAQLAYLGARLDALDDADGSSVLDNSVIWWCTDVSWGYVHSFDNIRAFLLGGGGGSLRRGEHIVLAAPEPHQRLLVTLLTAMGLPDDRFGDTSYTDADGNVVDIAAGPLPGVLA